MKQCKCSHEFICLHSGPYDKDEVIDTRPDYQPPPYTLHPNNNRVQKYHASVGDDTTMSCQIENTASRTSWRRLDGRPLPRNSYSSGGDLNFYSIQLDAAGTYECVVHEQYGDYPLVTAELLVNGKKNTYFSITHIIDR